jgi:hypothetical protein
MGSIFATRRQHISTATEHHVAVKDTHRTKTSSNTSGKTPWLGTDRQMKIGSAILREISLLRTKETEFAGSLVHTHNGPINSVQLWNNKVNTWQSSLAYDSEINFHTHDDGGYARTDINMPSPADFGAVLNWSMPHHFNQAHLVCGQEGWYVIQVSGRLRALALIEFNKGKAALQSYITNHIQPPIQASVARWIFKSTIGRDNFLAEINQMGFVVTFYERDVESITINMGHVDRVGELPYDADAILSDEDKQHIENNRNEPEDDQYGNHW